MFVQEAHDLKDSQLFYCSEICQLLASHFPVTLLSLCIFGHFGSISGLSLWKYYNQTNRNIIMVRQTESSNKKTQTFDYD